MSAIALLGLALLPAIFFLSVYLLAPRLQVLRMLFTSAAILSILVFFAQAAVEVPSMAAAFGGFEWLAIALLGLYLLYETLDLLNSLLITFGGLVKKG